MVVPFIRFPNTIFIRGGPYDGESRFWRCKALQGEEDEGWRRGMSEERDEKGEIVGRR